MTSAIERRLEELEVENSPSSICGDSIVALNNTANISVLPPEILSRIFLLYAELSRGTTLAEEFSWINAFSICSHWRTVAIQTPEIWVAIPNRCQGWHDEMLSRSKSCPIIVELREAYPSPVALCNVIHALSASPARSINVSTSGTFMPAIVGKLCDPAPFLEYLALYNREPSNPLRLLKTFLAGSAERLSELTLKGFNFLEVDHSIFRHLKHLQISRCGLESRPSTSHLLDLFDTSPNIEILNLDDSLPLDYDASSRTTRLGSLRALLLSGTYQACASFIRHLSYPATANLAINATESPQNITEIAAYIRGDKKFQEGNPIFLLQLIGSDHPGTDGDGLAVGIHVKPDFDIPRVSLDLSWVRTLADDTSQTKLNQLIDSVISTLDLIHLHKLDLAHLPVFSATAWNDVLRRIPNVYALLLRGRSSLSVICALSDIDIDILRENENETESNVHFPRLNSVILDTVDFEQSCDINGKQEILIDVLIDFFMARCNIDRPINELKIEGCQHINEDRENRLKEIVPCVSWDGYGDEDSEYDEGGGDYAYDEDEGDYEYEPEYDEYSPWGDDIDNGDDYGDF